MKLIIVGASGQGKVVADIAEKNGYDEIEFYDDNESITSCGKWPVTGKTERVYQTCDNIIIAIGNPDIRKNIMESFSGHHFPVLIHPNAVVADDVVIGEGSVVMAGAVINPGTKIGKGAIINTCSSVDHDCMIEDYVHVSVGAHLSGNITVGEKTWVGAGAIVSNSIEICSGCMIGAGAVVVKNITEPGTYIGIPARRHK